MDNNVIRKRLNTFKTSEGRLRRVSDEVIIDALRAWENWSGTTAELYRELGLSKMQMVTILKKAKKLVESGVAPVEEFKQIEVKSAESPFPHQCGTAIELSWDCGKVIRFPEVDLLVDFLKKAA